MTNFLEKLWESFRRSPLLYVAYDSGGQKKPTILLIHGVAATSNVWKPLEEALDDKYRVVAVDILGCGKSPRPKNCQYRTEDFVKSIHRTARKLKLKKPYMLVGHSMGSNIAASYAVRYRLEVWVEYLLSMPLYLKSPNLKQETSRQTDLYLKAYDFLLKNKSFTIVAAQTIRKLLNIKEAIDVNADDWEAFSLSLKNTIIHQSTYYDIKRTKDIPIHVVFGNLDEFLVRENFKQLKTFQNVMVSKLFAVDHLLSHHYAKFVADQIEADYNDYLGE
jgi:pimeloyl-ACP methyl ester carboxylesterase